MKRTQRTSLFAAEEAPVERTSRTLLVLQHAVVSVLAAAPLCTSAVGQEVRRVDAARPGAEFGDGLSWATAYKSLDDALAEALVISGEVQIWLAEGVYVPSVAPSVFGGGTQRDNTFWLPDQTGIFGGFRGGVVDEQSLADRARSPWRTILSGNVGDTRFEEDNTFHVVVAGNPQAGDMPTLDQTLDTLVIQDGHSNGGGVPADFSREGAGLFATRANNLTITNCVFRNNLARRGGAIHMFGGELGMSYCIFEDNWGRNEGGALWLSANSSMSRIQNCLFRRNASNGWDPAQINPPGFGGAVYAQELVGTAQFVNCVFYDNFSAWGGAVYTGTNDPISTIETEWINCTFAANWIFSIVPEGTPLALQHGPALYFKTGDKHRIRNTILWGNSPSPLAQEAIAVASGTLSMDSTDFQLPQTTVWTGTNNITVDPLFEDLDAENLYLTRGSPVLDLGNNSFLPSSDPLDLDGDGDTTEELPVSFASVQARRTCQCFPPPPHPVVDLGAHEAPALITKRRP